MSAKPGIIPPPAFANYNLEVAKGIFETESAVEKFGTNDAVGTNWATVSSGTGAGLYTYITSGQTVKISSTSNNDTSAGTGARTVVIEGLDSTNWYFQKETIILNGQTAVESSLSYIRVFRCYVTSAGSSTYNEGTIYVGTGNVTAGVPDNIHGAITRINNIGVNQSLMGLYTIPAVNSTRNQKGYLQSLSFSTGVGKSATIGVFIRNNSENVFRIQTLMHSESSNYRYEYKYPIELEEKTDIEIRAYSSGAGTQVDANFTIHLTQFDD